MLNMLNRKILVVFGTRPEAIKMAPIVKLLQGRNDFEVSVCVTGQHREMLDQVLRLFDIQADFDLEVMKPNQTIVDITSAVLHGVSEIIEEVKPDVLLVHGDTTTTFAASLAAYYQRIPVGHVEAGLRTKDIYAPWPEEGNRKFVACITTYHFAPTVTAKINLLAEGIEERNIYITGNTVIDALLDVTRKIDTNKQLRDTLAEQFSYVNWKKKIVLVTGHRRENFGDGFDRIASALAELSKRDDVEIIYPVHLNPNVQEPIKKALSGIDNIYLVPPLDYLPFVYLLSQSYMVITDSGGIQEEAPALGKPVLVMRDVTERPEGVDAGTVKLVGTSVERIVDEANKLLNGGDNFMQMVHSHNPYGDGLAAERIVNILQGKKYASFI